MPVRIETNSEPIPGYQLIERIGGGGFGEVWKARAPGGLLKAIKFVSGDLNGVGDVSQRAEQELKALKRVKDVRHPYILSLERIEVNEDGQLIIVMELAERNLADRYKECKERGLPGIPREELLRYMEEAAEALDLMNNTYQLQHLDIKPANLFVMFNHVKVADFGLVKFLEGAQASVTGGVTPVYAAPETFDGVVTRFSDQYSLAIVYQELLTGKRPFTGTSIRQLIVQHLQAVPDISPLPAADQPIILKALSKRPDERHQTCQELVRLLRANSSPGIAQAVSPANGAPALSPGQMLTRPDARNRSYSDETPSALLETGLIRSVDRHALEGTPESTPAPRSAESLRPVLQEPPSTSNPIVTEDGCLFPTLVIGLGQSGLSVLQTLRGRLYERLGPLGRVPNMRLMQLDTDPEVLRAATRGSPGTALSASEVVLAELNRPSHYIKAREVLGLNDWMNPRMLYRIPRSQVTAGFRALGRLAFCDNYRSICRRLQAELKACTDAAALKKAGRDTGLGVRTNQPRVYVVTNLAGGTGGGMFIDLAYTIRSQLRRLGWDKPEIMGMFLLPPVERTRPRTMPLGNAYAALKELEHFGKPEVTFQAKYHEHEPALVDAGPPFQRCVFLPMPDETDEPAGRQLTELASQALYRDICSPMGRVLDDARAASVPDGPSQRYFTFGLYNLVWPRRTLLQQASRKICHTLVQRWLSKDSKPIRDQVRDWVQERWQEKELAADHFITRLRQAAEDSLGKQSDTVFLEVLSPLINRITAPPQANGRQKTASVAEMHGEEIREALQELVKLVGKPEDDHCSDQPATLVQLLRDKAAELGAEWEEKLAVITVDLIESPAYRLAGAEEAIRQATATIEQVLQHQEPLAMDLANRAIEVYSRLQAFVSPVPGARRSNLTTLDALEMLRSYPKWRFQSVVLQQLANAFLRLRGHLSDDLRDVNFCRVRLGELQRLFETPPKAVVASEAIGLPKTGRCLFPTGCANLSEALDQYLACLTPEAYLEADTHIQEAIKREYHALTHVCLTPANILKKVEVVMLETAEAFAAERLAEVEVTDMYLSQFTDETEVMVDLARCFKEAVPQIRPKADAPDMHVLAAPPGPGTDQLREFLDHALPDSNVVVADTEDDIVMYREHPSIALTDLEQFGPAAEDAYRLMSGTENFTPHTRIDVQFD